MSLSEKICLNFRLNALYAEINAMRIILYGHNYVNSVRDLELHLASRMTDRRCRPLWAWNDDHVTGRRWLEWICLD